MMLSRSFRQRRSRAGSSATDSSDVSTWQGLLRRSCAKFGREFPGRHVERILLKEATDDGHRRRPQDVVYERLLSFAMGACLSHGIPAHLHSLTHRWLYGSIECGVACN